MLIREAIAFGAKELNSHRCDDANPLLECEALLCHALRCSREKLFAMYDQPLSGAQERKFRALLRDRASHTPLAWILGTGFFADREFIVTPDTLIPRHATEYVVEAARRAAADVAGSQRPVTEAVDVGTGSGCIAVTLALGMPDVAVFATDTSIPAFAVARRNAKKYGVYAEGAGAKQGLPGKVTLFKTNLLGYAPTKGHASRRPLPLGADATTLIVANLPYIPDGDRSKLAKCVLAEPASALFSGKDGLDASRELLVQLQELLARRPNKRVILAYEILPKQFAPLSAAVRRAFPKASKPQRIQNGAGVTVGLLTTTGSAAA